MGRRGSHSRAQVSGSWQRQRSLQRRSSPTCRDPPCSHILCHLSSKALLCLTAFFGFCPFEASYPKMSHCQQICHQPPPTLVHLFSPDYPLSKLPFQQSTVLQLKLGMCPHENFPIHIWTTAYRHSLADGDSQESQCLLGWLTLPNPTIHPTLVLAHYTTIPPCT